MLRRICRSTGKSLEFAYHKEKPCILSSSMQKHLKGSSRDTAYIKFLENMRMRATLNVNLCRKANASPFIHFGEHLSRFWLVLQAAGVCWDSESRYSSLGNELPFQRDPGKGGKMKVTATHGEVRGRQREMKSRCPGFESHRLLKMCLLERPSGRSQVFQLVCWDITVNRQRDSNSDLPAASDFGVLGSLCSSSCHSAAVAWDALRHHCLLGAQEGTGSRFYAAKAQRCPSAASADLFCGYSHHHP